MITTYSRTGLRLAILVESSSAGVGRHVIDLAEGLLSAGHSVDVLYSSNRADSRFLSGIDRLKAIGAKIAPIDMAHGLHPSDLTVIRKVRQHLIANGPFDFLHCHSTKAGLIGRLAALGLSCKTIYTPHAFYTMSPVAGRLSRQAAHVIEWVLSRVGNEIICCSEEERVHARGLRLPEHKLSVVSNGIDVSQADHFRARRAEIRERFGLKDGDICVGFVGRMFPQKDPVLLAKAFARAVSELSVPARLVIVGNGPLMPALKEQAELLGIADRTVFAGEIDGTLGMSAFDVFALPSRYEGFPYVLVEALAMGLPIISTAVGGATTLVRSGVNGVVVPVGNSGDFADALRTLLLDNDLRARMGVHSLSFAQNFSIDRMLHETVAVYQQARRRTGAGRTNEIGVATEQVLNVVGDLF